MNDAHCNGGRRPSAGGNLGCASGPGVGMRTGVGTTLGPVSGLAAFIFDAVDVLKRFGEDAHSKGGRTCSAGGGLGCASGPGRGFGAGVGTILGPVFTLGEFTGVAVDLLMRCVNEAHSKGRRMTSAGGNWACGSASGVILTIGIGTMLGPALRSVPFTLAAVRPTEAMRE